MTKEDKQLLLKDLCARIPYRTFVCLNPGAYNKPETCILIGIDDEQVYLNIDSDPFRIDHIKPYLRLMSSMTMEEQREYISVARGMSLDNPSVLVDWLYEHHFDFRGLIEKSLALVAPEGMYK